MSCLFLSGIEQEVYYFLIPKSINELFLVNIPQIIHEAYHEWIENKTNVDLFLDTGGMKYTFYDAKVDRCIIRNNRFGIPSRDLSVKFSTLLVGWRKRNA